MQTIGKFVPAPIPSFSVVPAGVVEQLERGEVKYVEVHADVTAPRAYALSMAKAKYLRQRGIRAAYRNNYTAPRKGGAPYSYGQTILVARGQRLPEGFIAAV